MAKKDVFYFSHDYNARNDIKIRKLLMKHGMVGYGVYWAIVEDLYNNSNELPEEYDIISDSLRVEESLVKSVINDFGLFIVNNGFFGSVSISERLNKMYEKSNKTRKSAICRWENYRKNANAVQSQSERSANNENRNAIYIEYNINEKKEIKESASQLTESNGIKLESWEKAKNLLRNDKVYLESLCMSFGCTLEVLNTRLEAFLKRLHDTGDWKDVPALKKHLKNSISKHGLSVDAFFEKEGRKTAVIEAPEQINAQDWENAWNTPTVDENWAGYKGE